MKVIASSSFAGHAGCLCEGGHLSLEESEVRRDLTDTSRTLFDREFISRIAQGQRSQKQMNETLLLQRELIRVAFTTPINSGEN